MPKEEDERTVETVPWMSEVNRVELPEAFRFDSGSNLKTVNDDVFLFDITRVARLKEGVAEPVFNSHYILFEDIFNTRIGLVGAMVRQGRESVVTPLTAEMEEDSFNRPFKIPGKFLTKRREGDPPHIGCDGSSIYFMEGPNVEQGRLRIVNPENGENETLELPGYVSMLHGIYSHGDHIWVTASIKRGPGLKKGERVFKIKDEEIVKIRVLQGDVRQFDNDVFYTDCLDNKIHAEGANSLLWSCEKPLEQGWIVGASGDFVHYWGYDKRPSSQLALLQRGTEVARIPLSESRFLFAHGPTAYLALGRGEYIEPIENGRGYGLVAFRDFWGLGDSRVHAIGGDDLYIADKGKTNRPEVFHAKIGRKQLVD